MFVQFLILLIISDVLSMSAAYRITYLMRVESGLFQNPLPVELIGPMIFLSIYWVILFALRGMYRTPVVISRFDELFNALKAIVIGLILLFIATFDISEPLNVTRIFLFTYGVTGFILMGAGRILIRIIQRNLRSKGVGLKKAVIVGFNEVGRSLNNQLYHWPVWGFKVIGFIDRKVENSEHLGIKILGNVEDIPMLLEKKQIHWVLIAPQRHVQDSLIEVLNKCSHHKVRFMLVASYYQMVVGLVRTVEIHGLPLVEVMPQLVTQTTLFVKRMVDIIISFIAILGLGVALPFIAIAIKIDSKGSIFYSQRRVGRRGVEFNLLKFRSMVQDAEERSGAIWAVKDDTRITKVGRLLRKFYIDEVPQFINVILGHMSIVGPRPERPHFVNQFRDKIPLYERRLRVRPGITGWAQIRHKYDESIDDVQEKTRYDLFYIDHIALSTDLKIILSTLRKVFGAGGH